MVLATALLVIAILTWPEPLRRVVARSTRESGLARPAASDAGSSVAGRVRGAAPRLADRLRRRVQPGTASRGWVADFAELAAVGLDAGLPAAEAARLACDVGGSARTRTEFAMLGQRITHAVAHGEAVGGCLRAASDGDRDLTFLAAAWQLSDEFGVAAAPAARTSAAVLRERAASEDRRMVLAAGPRASMWLLTLLPLAGPLVVVVLGLPVDEVYGGVASMAATGVGLVLTGLGWLWSRSVLRRALRAREVA
ncbi:type II secretion system F family protein [Knoellia subterranea]|uniref:Type II secretion system protein GspF domain-containing protein n=1 Tax=Knoellia subterranea KCTC 19937 TaxID=1385521 RepID=A0A0A0JQL1_9MICO|nr:type II secretion system F family protein [Knoellia subterranea]KGN38327.1 hypothetical protein N803_10035 [Knoellia subterranea KCTC 19937]